MDYLHHIHKIIDDLEAKMEKKFKYMYTKVLDLEEKLKMSKKENVKLNKIVYRVLDKTKKDIIKGKKIMDSELNDAYNQIDELKKEIIGFSKELADAYDVIAQLESEYDAIKDELYDADLVIDELERQLSEYDQ